MEFRFSNSSLANGQNASVMSGGGFIRGTKFRYSGRTEREILTESLNALRAQHLLNNTSPSKRKANSVPVTPSSPHGDLIGIRKSNESMEFKENGKNKKFVYFIEKVTAVYRDQPCPNQWDVQIVFVKRVPYHVWKLYAKKFEGMQVCRLCCPSIVPCSNWKCSLYLYRW